MTGKNFKKSKDRKSFHYSFYGK